MGKKKGIIEEIREHFNMAFTLDNAEPNEGILECIPNQISADINRKLENDVSSEEIKVRHFSWAKLECWVRMFFQDCFTKGTGT